MRTAAERRLAARVLREEPLCRRCHTSPSVEVDHIRCVAAGGARGERENLQGLCHPCHVTKTGEDRQLMRELRAAAHGPPPF